MAENHPCLVLHIDIKSDLFAEVEIRLWNGYGSVPNGADPTVKRFRNFLEPLLLLDLLGWGGGGEVRALL